MKNSIKLEELAMFGLALFMHHILGYSWGLFFLLLLTPDISMVGYLINDSVGANLYNIAHHKGVAILVYFIGAYLELPLVQLTGTILFAHSCMDRMFGYGLKYKEGFKFTHLGKIGNSKK